MSVETGDATDTDGWTVTTPVDAGSCPLSSDEFIEEVEVQLEQAGLTNVVRVDLSAPSRGVVSLDYLEVIDKGTLGARLGARALQLLLELSDRSGVALVVIPHSFDGPMSDDDLAAWYGRHGFMFAPTMDTPRQMRRDPGS